MTIKVIGRAVYRDGIHMMSIIGSRALGYGHAAPGGTLLTEHRSGGMHPFSFFRDAVADARATLDRDAEPGRPRSEHPFRYQVRHSAEQMAAWQAAAQAEGRELQNWIRRTLDAAAKKAAKKP